jgi:Fur family transcriptional regulator, ferric uptake regulator
MNTVQDVLENIHEKGNKLTKTRKAMVDMLVSSHNLLTAPQIQEELEKLGINLNKTTIYRELDYLQKNKIIQEVNIKPGIVHYESALLPHHHHVTCKTCGLIKDVDAGELDKLIEIFEKKIESQGFRVLEHSLEFYGLCKKCNSQSS